jgi:hypothetical protein
MFARTRILALAAGLLAAGPALADEPGLENGGAPRFEIRTDVYFYDTDILRDAYAREPYRTTILVDRNTGQSWVLMKVGENRVVWSAVDFRNSDGKVGARPR